MAEATQRLLRRHANTTFTFAGEGPDEPWLRKQFAGEERVTFCRYRPEETLGFHGGHHIAVVPSIGSEGTSLSVAEAMAAGCSVVATAVGGITNMVIHGYNGLLVMPDADSLYEALAGLIVDPELRCQLGKRALDTARVSFSRERWEGQWCDVLREIAQT